MDGSQTLAGFRAKFRVDELLVAKTPAWSWSVRPGQATLGCGVLSLNRHAAQFSEVTAAEMADLSGLLGKLERAVQSAFGYDRINYLMLMMVDHQVHFHVIPRYAASRQFAGLEWVDPGWPAFPALTEQQHDRQADILALIHQELQAACTD
ncbi:MAG: HIT family protein [Accumulibacter sp.]|jgi:diadenosine tetraphosphate (Ap4A) HIT family hydrolase|uniref:HIT family protein n=1 Tax=Accumulibacter sp. TaxID=2053492 RepID=UPI002FC2E13D